MTGRQGRRDAGIDPPRQKEPHRDVGDQVLCHHSVEDVMQFVLPLLTAPPVGRVRRREPEIGDRPLSLPVDALQVVTRRQLGDPLQRGEVVIEGKAEFKELPERHRFDPGGEAGQGEKRLDFGGKGDPCPPWKGEIVERLDAERVPGQQQPPGLRRPDGKGEHPAEPRETAGPPCHETAEHHLRIGAGDEPVPELLQLAPELPEVVQFAVVDENGPPILAEHRLVAGGAQVDDTEAVMGQGDAAGLVRVVPPVIGPPVGEGIGHQPLLTDVPCFTFS